ncbi:hypothetical protein OS188_13820 [Xanthomarina sp. F1114]|uniref:hypothetical protein n=1 Tax=Xanthomarina sp. F1114 TaxID=2996019 RepID=UPI00225E2D23|nr:hypothetical protein [Xanthomarina sp. F1114]MCX7549029.1 hypothetical protein [Xanthomarina sp. F1114]
MVRVRENSSEFGNCSRVKKQFRLALLPFFQGIKSRAFHSDLVSLFMRIKALDQVSERGKRQVYYGMQTAKGRQLMKRHSFVPEKDLVAGFCRQATFNWTTQQLDVSDFNPGLYKVPKTATHIGVTLGVLDFDFETLEYSLSLSSIHFVALGAGVSSFSLTPEQVLVPAHVGFVVLGLRYYELIENEVYAFKKPLGVRVLDVLV